MLYLFLITELSDNSPEGTIWVPIFVSNDFSGGGLNMGGFPLTGWLIMIVPPVLMILSVALWYVREVKMEKLENELIRKNNPRGE